MGRDIRRAQGEPFLLSPHRSVVIWNETKISTIEEGNMQYQMIPERVAPPLPPKTRQPKWAILTLCLVIAIWVCYLVGLPSLSQATLYSPVSPDIQAWWFFTVAPYPNCEDRRPEAWRLLSAQLVHSGLLHIAGNTLCILFFGSIVEMYHHLSHVAFLLIMEVSLVIGILFYALLFPYIGLVGASPGGYGLIGACWWLAFFDRSLLPPVLTFCLPPVLITELVCDVIVYTLTYKTGIAYTAHVAGLLGGFLLSAALTAIGRKSSTDGRCWGRGQVQQQQEIQLQPSAPPMIYAHGNSNASIIREQEVQQQVQRAGQQRRARPPPLQAAEPVEKIGCVRITCSFIAAILFIILSSLLVMYYLKSDPPQPVWINRKQAHNTGQTQACCAVLFDLMKQYPEQSQSSLVEQYPCQGDY